ncbi:MAG: hypothetical protein AAF589_02940 [Planctomycetota bacterium]
MKKALLAVVASCLSAFAGDYADASLVVNLQEVSSDGVEVSWEGNGTFTGNIGIDLTFINFGTFLGSGIGDPESFVFSQPLTLSGIDLSTSSPYTNNYTGFDLRNQSGDDILFDSSGTNLVTGDTFTASGSAIVTGLAFSDLVPGTYSGSGVDSTRFGGVTLVIAAIPEPTAFVFGGLVSLGFVGLIVTRRRRKTASEPR